MAIESIVSIQVSTLCQTILLNLYSGKTDKSLFSDIVEFDKTLLDSLYIYIDNQPDSVLNFNLVNEKIDFALARDSANYLFWYVKGLTDAKLQNYNSGY